MKRIYQGLSYCLFSNKSEAPDVHDLCHKHINARTSIIKLDNVANEDQQNFLAYFSVKIQQEIQTRNKIRDRCYTHSCYLQKLRPLFEINEEAPSQDTEVRIYIVPYPEFAILLGQYNYVVSQLLAKQSCIEDIQGEIEKHIYHADLLHERITSLNHNCKVRREVAEPSSLYAEYERYFNPTVSMSNEPGSKLLHRS